MVYCWRSVLVSNLCIARTAQDYKVDPRDIFFALGKRNAVAGQESLIIEVAQEIAAKNENRKG